MRLSMAPIRVVMTLEHANGDSVAIDVDVYEEWAPLGAARFLDLIRAKYFKDAPLYRFIPGFIVQWGVPTDPHLWKAWGEKKIKDDPVKTTNALATLSFATSGPGTPLPHASSMRMT